MNAAAITGFFINVARFIILLGVLVFVHELGHFLAAKATNVYVVRLALGFGKRLFGFQWGETDYCVKAIPLGGYVKMVGQEDLPRTQEEAEKADPEVRGVPPERRFDTQPAWKKLLIGFAGPAMNLLFAIPVLWLVYMVGINIPVSSDYPFIGGVTAGSPAEEAGIQTGQRVLSIDGQAVKGWEDVQLQIMTNKDNPLDIKLEDLSGKITDVTVTPRRSENSTRPAIGIDPLAALSIDQLFPGMPAEESGLQRNDIVLTYDQKPPSNENLSNLFDAVNKHAGEPLSFTVLRNGKILTYTITPKKVPVIKGIEIRDGVIALINKEELGAEADNLKLGDTVVALDGQPVKKNVEDMLRREATAGETVELTIRRGGILEKSRDIKVSLPIVERGMIGVAFSGYIKRQYDPGTAFVKSFSAYEEPVSLTFKTLYYLITGKVSTREMAGPIGIAVLTTESLKLGVGYYLKLVAFITINLGIINLLPIPMLDGGMILITMIEAVRRKPLEEKYQLLLQRIGFAFIIFLFLIVTYNDILRTINYFLGHGFME